jgi:hypothetical protein
MGCGRGWFFLSLLLLSACDRSAQNGLPVTELSVTPGCEVQQGCQAGDSSLSVSVQFGDTPRALQPFPLGLQFSGDEPVEQVTVSFSMQGMDMGLNRYRLTGDKMSGWKADITLPICVSGRSDWIAEFELVTDQRRLQFSLPFVLQKN